MTDRVSVTEIIAAPSRVVYDLVRDLVQMGGWSPESSGGRWLPGSGPTLGGRFVGRNQTGNRCWFTLTTVTHAVPARRFAFRVTAPIVPIAHWEYRLEETDDGCRVEEVWVDLRPPAVKVVSTLRTGVADRVSFNRQSMRQTLEGLKLAAEARQR